MEAVTAQRVKLLHPKIREEVAAAVEHINSKILGKGVRLRLAYTLRTFEEQAALYAQGRTQPGKIVTNAKAGQSVHNYGLAFDIVLLLDKNGDGIFEEASWDTKADFDKDGTADWMEVVNYFKGLGYEWGGSWQSFPDYPHFEKTFTLRWKDLYAKFSVGETFPEVIEGKRYQWIRV